jgi:tetratricopeptide (TPR) repeat protein
MNWQDEPRYDAWPKIAAMAHAAAAARPNDPSVWISLGKAAVSFGKLREADEFLSQAIARMPDSAGLRLTLARVKLMQDAFEDALAQVAAVLEREPDNRDARLMRFDVLFRIGHGGADPFVDDAAALDPLQPHVFDVWAKRWRDREGLTRLLARCDAALAEKPIFTNGVYFKALTLARLGRAEDARDTLSTRRFVSVSDLLAPAGFASGAAFREALAAEIARNPTIAANPRAKGTRGGRRPRRLRQPGAPLIEILIQQFKQAIDAHVARIVTDTGGFGYPPPAKAALDVWATLFGGDGYELSHHHPSGWLSGVYYVSAPRLPDETGFGGALLLGALDTERHGVDAPWEVRRIEPAPGRLVLFPSYIPHATEPSGLDGERISVAFDVIPVQ